MGVRAAAVVTWDLDMIPGWNHKPEDVRDWLQHKLNEAMGHYKPMVRLDVDRFTDDAHFDRTSDG